MPIRRGYGRLELNRGSANRACALTTRRRLGGSLGYRFWLVSIDGVASVIWYRSAICRLLGSFGEITMARCSGMVLKNVTSR